MPINHHSLVSAAASCMEDETHPEYLRAISDLLSDLLDELDYESDDEPATVEPWDADAVLDTDALIQLVSEQRPILDFMVEAGRMGYTYGQVVTFITAETSCPVCERQKGDQCISNPHVHGRYGALMAEVMRTNALDDN